MKQHEFEETIRFLKRENQMMGWNELDLKAADLLKKAGSSAVKECTAAMMACMLEGDRFLSGSPEHTGKDMTVRYYCDNLSESRRRMF